MGVLDVVAVGPTVVLVFIAAVWVLLVPIVVDLVIVGFEGGWADGGASLLHDVACLLLPVGGWDVGVGPIHRRLLLERAGHLVLYVGGILHGVGEYICLLGRCLVELILKCGHACRHVGFELLLAFLQPLLAGHHCVGALIKD